MQQLHLVGFTTDHDGLIYSARRGAKSGSFVIELDDDLVDTIEELLRLRDGGGDDGHSHDGASQHDHHHEAPVLRTCPPRPPRPESFLTPW